MTLGDAIQEVMDLFESISSGIRGQEVREALVRAHTTAQQSDHLWEETIVTDTAFTWTVADGTDNDISGDLTRWRGEPVWITSDGQGNQWSRVPILQLLEARLNGGSASLVRGGLAYAVQVDTLMIVSAFSSDEEITVTHFKNPAKWGATSGLDEKPLLPTDFHDYLVYMASLDLYRRFMQEEDKAYLRKQFGQDYAKLEDKADTKWKEMKRKHGRIRGWWRIAGLPPLSSDLLHLQRKIRRFK